MRKTITKEIEIITCDICGEETEHLFECQVCGRDICSNCKADNMCKSCWKDDCSFATIKSTLIEENGYKSRSFTTIKIEHESKARWNDLVSRFVGKRVKITIEEFPKHEEIKPKNKLKGLKELVDGRIKSSKSSYNLSIRV